MADVSVSVGTPTSISVTVAGSTGGTPTVTNGGTAIVTVTNTGDRGPQGEPGTVNLSDATPAAIGSSSAGTSSTASRSDHSHPPITASKISDFATEAAKYGPVTSVNGMTGAVTISGGGSGVTLSDATPSPLGTASPGTSSSVSRADHTHASPGISGVTGLQAALDAKQDAGSYAAASHTHTASQISDRATALVTSVNGQTGDVTISGGSGGSSYTLPTASASTLGGIKVGSGLSISSGVLAADVTTVAGRSGAVVLSASDVSGLASVATSGKYSDLSSIPTTFAPSAHSHAIGDVTGLQTALDAKAATSSLATVATSGSYTDLSNKPASYSLPVASSTTLGGVKQGTNVTIGVDGTISVAAPVTSLAASAITGLATSATTDTTNASNISSGTLPAARLPATAVTVGSYGSASSVGTFTVDSAGRLTAAGSTAIAISSGAVSGLAASATTDTTSASNISSGTLPAARLPATTVTAGSYGSASSVATYTVDSTGRLTAAGSTAIAIGTGAITGLAASATTDTTSASNISTGTLAAARLPSTAVTAGSYGSASTVATFTVDGTGRLTAAGSTGIAIASSAVSGLAASATTDTTSATNISSGTLAAARLPLATSSTAGAVIVGGGISVSSGTISADLRSNTSGITGANAVTNIVYLTSAAYSALSTKSSTTLYIVSG